MTSISDFSSAGDKRWASIDCRPIVQMGLVSYHTIDSNIRFATIAHKTPLVDYITPFRTPLPPYPGMKAKPLPKKNKNKKQKPKNIKCGTGRLELTLLHAGGKGDCVDSRLYPGVGGRL
jgi:hypothetical protein